jgi:hypothetical protein
MRNADSRTRASITAIGRLYEAVVNRLHPHAYLHNGTTVPSTGGFRHKVLICVGLGTGALKTYAMVTICDSQKVIGRLVVSTISTGPNSQ